MLKKILIKMFSPINKWVILFRKKSILEESPIFIFSEGRGGSTWLMEVINHYKKGVTIFEPFGGAAFGFDNLFSGFSFPFDYDTPEEGELVKVFLNNVNSLDGITARNARFNSFQEVWNNKGLVVKIVNKTLVLSKLLDSNYFSSKPILLIRSPIDILKSRSKYGFSGFEKEVEVNVNTYWKLRENSILITHLPYLKSLRTNYELYVAEWCIAHGPFLHPSKYTRKITIINYIDMKEDSMSVIKRLKNEYGFLSAEDYDFNKKSGSTNRAFQVESKFKVLPYFSNRVKAIFEHFNINQFK